MTTTDPNLLRALEFSGNLLFAVTAAVVVFGLLVVVLSFRNAPRPVTVDARPQHVPRS
jgi:hypothetical protein